MCILSLLKVVGYYDLSVLSMSVMGFQKKYGWVGGWGELYPSFFGICLTLQSPLVSEVTCNFNISSRPDFKFHEHFRGDGSKEEEPKRKILQRDRDCVSAEEVRLA